MWGQQVFILELVFIHYPLWHQYFTWCPVDDGVCHSSWWEKALFLVPWNLWALFLWIFLTVLPQPEFVSSHLLSSYCWYSPTREGPSANFWRSPSVQLSPFWYSSLHAPAVFAFPDTHPSPPNSRTRAGSSWTRLPFSVTWKLSPGCKPGLG